MKDKLLDPQHLDITAFARAGATLGGQLAQATMARLAPSLLPIAGDAAPAFVDWTARGESRAVAGAEAEVWLHVEARAIVALECQRCLQPLLEPLVVARSLRFVRDEDEAARLDEESEDDVLALPRWLDLAELVEDELILALPLVPRHEDCGVLLPMSAGDDDAPEADPPHPFAALAALRRSRS